jgi:RNA polymerase sigma factor (TIGR02999 family)
VSPTLLPADADGRNIFKKTVMQSGPRLVWTSAERVSVPYNVVRSDRLTHTMILKSPMPSSLTELFERIDDGDSAARGQLFSLVYAELHLIARGLLHDHPAHSLQSGELVNDAYLRLVKGDAKALKRNRAYFFGAAARAMRQVLIDSARKWRPPLTAHTPVEVVAGRASVDVAMIEGLDKALDELAEHNRELAEIVELRIFAGMTIVDVANICDIGTATVERKFRAARAYLRSRIEEHTKDDSIEDSAGIGDF